MSTTSPLTLHHTSNERIAAVIAHAGTVFAWFLAPLVVYLVLPREARWARTHALSALLWSLVGTLVSIATCGAAIPFFLAFHVWAAIQTILREDYDYPLVAASARRTVYS